jgi:hypothetical protein
VLSAAPELMVQAYWPPVTASRKVLLLLKNESSALLLPDTVVFSFAL